MALRIGTLRKRLCCNPARPHRIVLAASPSPGPMWLRCGEIQPLTGHKLMSAQAVHSEVTHQIIVRWQSALANPQTVAAMRVVHNGRHFNIRASINEDERNRSLTLLTSEGMNDG